MDASHHNDSPHLPDPAPMSAGTRRPALLPAFEPISSSPPAPSNKRKYQEDSAAKGQYYPTPVPTSSTGILPSSPGARPGLKRTLSERAVLCDVPTVTIPNSGEPLLLGRSSGSCSYQFPYNRLISRVHVSVVYLHPSESNVSGQVRIECLGWNGCNVHCAGRVYGLDKGDVYVTSQPVAELILDVQDTRVILSWPSSARDASIPSDSSWSEASPSRRSRIGHNVFASSPPLQPRSPISPSPAPAVARNLFGAAAQEAPSWAVKVYEDPASDHADALDSPSKKPSHDAESRTGIAEPLDPSFASSANDLSDNENEENDPIIHSFGPLGSNILSRFNSFVATSPEAKRRKPLKETTPSPQRHPSASPHKTNLSPRKLRDSPIRNHVINQLAFSRVHAIPVSTILGNLPAGLKDIPPQEASSPNKDKAVALTHDLLREILHSIPCVGEIAREGKDAAGKPLENEFYYLPEMDDNQMRREAVTNGRGGAGLRAVRKSHKQYYWKRPRH